MLLGLVLFYVGAVLFLNGLWLIGRVGDREIAIINIFVGSLTLLVSLFLAFGPGADATSIKAAALTLLFSFTYFWVAYNRFHDVDGRGLGWYCLFVAITTVPVAIETLASAQTTWDIWFGLNWVAWGGLWLMFFMLLALGKPIAKATGHVTWIQAILTGWLPGYLLLSGFFDLAPAAAS